MTDSTHAKPWQKMAFLSLFATSVGITGCNDNANSDGQALEQANDAKSFKPLATFYTPNQANIHGQQSALNHFLSRRWQLKNINHIPIAEPVSIDLSDFTHGHGTAFTSCDRIDFILDTSKLASGGLSISKIERKMNDCTHNIGDDIMRIFGDLHSFHRKDDVLILISLKDEIELIPES